MSGLALTRRPGEELYIGDEITVTVLSIRGNQVSLLIDAPRDMVILRKEVFDRMQMEKQEKPADDELSESECSAL